MALTLDPTAWTERPGIPAILAALSSSAGATRLVGGAVRDLLLGIEHNDLDLATRLLPREVIARLEIAGIKAVPTGIDHGTVTAVSDGTVVEVTTLRCDVSTDGRRATVAFTDDWQADAERRDFTINALFADPHSGQLFDHVGGIPDLQARRVRFIGEPLQRIAEDHLRILRFFRFHARFGTGEPDTAGLAACAARANDLMALSRERIADELLKLLALPDPSATVRTMVEHDILRAVLPEIAAASLPRLGRLVGAERDAGLEPQSLRRLAALLPPDPLLAEKVAIRLKLSNKARQRLASAAEPVGEQSPEALAYRVGTDLAQDRLLLASQPEAARSLTGWTIPKLPLGGGALIKRGLEPGPAVARTLQAIERQWIAAGFPEGAAFERIVQDNLAGVRR